MANSKRVCVFCGGSPVTREHHPPQWVLAAYPKKNYIGGYESRMKNSEWTDHGGLKKNLQIVVKSVCANCNNGWMAKIEDLTKPILEPMIRGESVRLKWFDQVVLATWFVKSALTLIPSIRWTHTTTFRQAFDDLYRQKKVTNFYEISVASCETNNLLSPYLATRKLNIRWPDGRSDQFQAFHYTALFGHVVATLVYRPRSPEDCSPSGPDAHS